jgi:hypothetical protein
MVTEEIRRSGVHLIQTLGRGAFTAAAVTLVAGMLGAPLSVRADVERIREKTLELEQKLMEHGYRYQARAEEPKTERIYKDFDFLLKQSKVDEVAGEQGDPWSEALRLYLIESTVNLDLAAFEDDLSAFKQTATVKYDEGEVGWGALLKDLTTASESAERRKIYSAMDDLFEPVRIFGAEILSRRIEAYQAWGFENFADFYATREAIDLAAVSTAAESFLEDTQELYEQVFADMAQTRLGVEARKVRFYDMPHLMQGVDFEQAFPLDERTDRVKGIFQGLGIQVGDNLIMDDKLREGKALAPGVFPALVPTEVYVSMNPIGGLRDDHRELVAVGEAMIFTLSTQTQFEPAYLVNQTAQAALAFVPRLVLDEPAWGAAAAKPDHFEAEAFNAFRAFAALHEARLLAASAMFEHRAYQGENENALEDAYRDLMKQAVGARLSSGDAKRFPELLTQLRSASAFRGLLLAAGIREDLRQAHGDNWFQAPEAGARLTRLWQRGGTLTVDDIQAEFPSASMDAAPIINHVQSLLGSAE